MEKHPKKALILILFIIIPMVFSGCSGNQQQEKKTLKFDIELEDFDMGECNYIDIAVSDKWGYWEHRFTCQELLGFTKLKGWNDNEGFHVEVIK